MLRLDSNVHATSAWDDFPASLSGRVSGRRFAPHPALQPSARPGVAILRVSVRAREAGERAALAGVPRLFFAGLPCFGSALSSAPSASLLVDPPRREGDSCGVRPPLSASSIACTSLQNHRDKPRSVLSSRETPPSLLGSIDSPGPPSALVTLLSAGHALRGLGCDTQSPQLDILLAPDACAVRSCPYPRECSLD